MRILLLEDCEDDADLLAIELAGAGLACEIRRAAARDAFAAQLASFAPHVVVSDANIPGFPLQEALALARGHDPALPFVILSGIEEQDLPARDRAHGADAWMCKERMTDVPTALRTFVPGFAGITDAARSTTRPDPASA